jgi:hypothetical protein
MSSAPDWFDTSLIDVPKASNGIEKLKEKLKPTTEDNSKLSPSRGMLPSDADAIDQKTGEILSPTTEQDSQIHAEDVPQ